MEIFAHAWAQMRFLSTSKFPLTSKWDRGMKHWCWRVRRVLELDGCVTCKGIKKEPQTFELSCLKEEKNSRGHCWMGNGAFSARSFLLVCWSVFPDALLGQNQFCVCVCWSAQTSGVFFFHLQSSRKRRAVQSGQITHPHTHPHTLLAHYYTIVSTPPSGPAVNHSLWQTLRMCYVRWFGVLGLWPHRLGSVTWPLRLSSGCRHVCVCVCVLFLDLFEMDQDVFTKNKWGDCFYVSVRIFLCFTIRKSLD